MPTKIEKDSITGEETTGHEWDGIKELNTPLPRWWVYVFYVTIIWSVGFVLLYPSIPFVNSYFGGLIGYSQRAALDEALIEARLDQAAFFDRVDRMTPAELLADPEMLTFSLAGGEAAFADNCAPCHGLGGAGNPGGFPVLADDDWLWGGNLDHIEYSIRHGIRNDQDEEARFSLMPTFGGEFGLLSREEIHDVANYVMQISGQEYNEERAARGAETFAQQCVSCHGEDGTGVNEFGAPNLTDAIWLYGGDRADVIAQITDPEHGVMPPWAGRLSEADIKMLTVYVHALGGGE